MNIRTLRKMALIVLGLMTTATVQTADARGNGSHGHHEHGRTRIIAALQPVGAAAGWGRVKVEDRIRHEELKRSGTLRKVEIELYDLEPLTSFSIQGRVATRSPSRNTASPLWLSTLDM